MTEYDILQWTDVADIATQIDAQLARLKMINLHGGFYIFFSYWRVLQIQVSSVIPMKYPQMVGFLGINHNGSS